MIRLRDGRCAQTVRLLGSDDKTDIFVTEFDVEEVQSGRSNAVEIDSCLFQDVNREVEERESDARESDDKGMDECLDGAEAHGQHQQTAAPKEE